MRAHTSDAVSPVVGVMLMLVVVIIIAALVSAFAGGMASSTEKAPQMSISGSFSQTKGFQLYHDGGDAIPTENFKILVRMHDTMKGEAMYTWQVNNSVVSNQDGTKYLVNPSTRNNEIALFSPGDVLFVSYQNREFMQERPDGTIDYTSSSYGFGHANNVGKMFEVEVVDNSGKIIARTNVVIRG